LHDIAIIMYKCLPQCKIEVDISSQQFVRMSALQNLTLKNEVLKKVLIFQKVIIFNLLVLTF